MHVVTKKDFIYGVFEESDMPDTLKSVWTTQELAEAEVERLGEPFYWKTLRLDKA